MGRTFQDFLGFARIFGSPLASLLDLFGSNFACFGRRKVKYNFDAKNHACSIGAGGRGWACGRCIYADSAEWCMDFITPCKQRKQKEREEGQKRGQKRERRGRKGRERRARDRARERERKREKRERKRERERKKERNP